MVVYLAKALMALEGLVHQTLMADFCSCFRSDVWATEGWEGFAVTVQPLTDFQILLVLASRFDLICHL